RSRSEAHPGSVPRRQEGRRRGRGSDAARRGRRLDRTEGEDPRRPRNVARVGGHDDGRVRRDGSVADDRRTGARMIELTAEEARVLGCLMEKAVTTPDNYPLSVNALISACNQSTNRDPVVSYSESTVERALEGLREKAVSRRVRATGQRVVKHRHVVDEELQLSVPEFTMFGLLLLRGAQTPGELKQRSERWHGFRSLDDVEAALQQLAEQGY